MYINGPPKYVIILMTSSCKSSHLVQGNIFIFQLKIYCHMTSCLLMQQVVQLAVGVSIGGEMLWTDH